MNTENLEICQNEYQAGKRAFERGEYRAAVQHLETANAHVGLNSRLGGEVQIWLVTAYQAVGQQEEAIALCKKLTRYPSLSTRQQARRLLVILEAPKLHTRPEWVIEIPDLDRLPESDRQDRRGSSTAVKSTPRKRPETIEIVDLSQVNTKDNQFIWVALIGIFLTLGGLIWLS